MKLHIRLAVSFLALLAWAANAATDVPSLNAILEKNIAAGGGKAAMEKVTSRHMKATIESQGMPAGSSFEALAKAPNKQLSTVTLAGIGTVLEGFDGKVAWSKSSFEGLKTKSGDELAKVKRDADFHKALRMKALYPDLAVKGTAKVNNETVYVLESKPSPTSVERFYFSANSGLLVQQESTFQANGNEVKATVNLYDYSPVDKVQYPRRLQLSIVTPGQNFGFTMKVTDVKHNVPIEDSRFSKPAE